MLFLHPKSNLNSPTVHEISNAHLFPTFVCEIRHEFGKLQASPHIVQTSPIQLRVILKAVISKTRHDVCICDIDSELYISAALFISS